MKSEHRRGSTAMACALLSAAALGQNLPGAPAPGDRERLLAHFERVAEADLKTLYLLCARVSSRRILAFDEAAHCSIAADVLKARSFAGDFDALLAWWRLHRDDRLTDSRDSSVQRDLLPAGRESSSPR
jgi:hypothetical protein